MGTYELEAFIFRHANEGSRIYCSVPQPAYQSESLASASSVVYLRSQLATVEYRISLAPDRGIASPGSHTLEDVYNERVPLYERYAAITVDVDSEPPETISGHIATALDS